MDFKYKFQFGLLRGVHRRCVLRWCLFCHISFSSQCSLCAGRAFVGDVGAHKCQEMKKQRKATEIAEGNMKRRDRSNEK